MEMKDVLEDLIIVGIGVTTDNHTEGTDQGLIPGIWERFIHEGLADKVPNRIGKDVFAVYCNYQGDHLGPYDYFLGVRVASYEAAMAGVKSKRIMKGTYAVMETEAGPAPQVVYRKWSEIWQMFDDELGGKRTYQTDFEIYGKKARDPDHAVVEIYVGVE